jgi:putative phosphoribosyl transferase
MDALFRDRVAAGEALARRLSAYAGRDDVVVLGLPRGGVPVAAVIAARLAAPLGIQLVRKLGAPGQPELAMGAIASGGIVVRNEDVLRTLSVEPERVEAAVRRERAELERRERAWLGPHPNPPVVGRTIIVVDDGMATGSTMNAALRALRAAGAARLVVAVPTGSQDACERARGVADDIVCLSTPEPYFAVGAAYLDFSQTSDDEVRRLLDRAAQRGGTQSRES